MSHLKIKQILFLLLILLASNSCSTGHSNTLISSYSLTNQMYTDVGYSKNEWEIWPLVTLDNEVSIKIHPSTWESFSFNEINCSDDFSTFYFVMWSQDDIFFDTVNSFFVTSSDNRVSFKNVKLAEKDKMVNSKIINNGIEIKPTSLSIAALEDLWKNNKHSVLSNDKARKFLKVTTSSFVGCSSDYYRLHLIFKSLKEGIENEYVFYFYPVEYKSFSR